MSDLTQQQKLAQALRRDSNYGLRPDATRKGRGYFGPLMDAHGDVATELSFDFENAGRNVLAPLIVPTLTAQELRHLLEGNDPTDAIYDKAEAHAIKRGNEGRSPFARGLEVHGLPK